MNIFATSSNPYACAIALDDRRLIKMILETTQLLSTAMYFHESPYTPPYKKTHEKHPCAKWARESDSNFNWLTSHLSDLSAEYTIRFNRIHKCAQFIDLFRDNYPFIPSGWLTPFVNCTPFKTESNVHEAYRKSLRVKWEKDGLNARWTRRAEPSWRY